MPGLFRADPTRVSFLCLAKDALTPLPVTRGVFLCSHKESHPRADRAENTFNYKQK
jgi:hypothetical protein